MKLIVATHSTISAYETSQFQNLPTEGFNSLFANINSHVYLKPQDVMVALKLCSYGKQRPAISVVAADLGLSASEVHGANKRLR